MDGKRWTSLAAAAILDRSFFRKKEGIMKAFAVMIWFMLALSAGVFAQEAVEPPGIQIIKYSWSKERIAWDNNPFSVPVETFNETRERVRDERRPKSALEERSIRAAKEEEKRPTQPPRYVFHYKILVHNVGAKAIKEIDWDYILTDAVTNEELGRHEFTSVETVGPGKRKELVVRISSPPTRSISVYSLGKGERTGLVEKVAVRRILYDDATVWDTVKRI